MELVSIQSWPGEFEVPLLVGQQQRLAASGCENHHFH
jgi:hypothetical protein